MRFFLSILLIFLFGCGTARISNKISKNEDDFIYKESFIRYTDDRLDKFESNPYFKGISLCYKGNYQEGLKFLALKLNERENEPEYWNQIGICHYLNNNIAKALFNFDLSISKAESSKKYRNYGASYNNKGLIFLKMRHYQTAINFIEKAFEKSRFLLVPKYNLIQIYIQFGLLDKARSILDDLLKKYPNDNDLKISLISLLTLEGKLDESNKIYLTLNDKLKKRSDISLIQAISLFKQNQFEKMDKELSNQESTYILSIKNSSSLLKSLANKKIKEIKTENDNRKKILKAREEKAKKKAKEEAKIKAEAEAKLKAEAEAKKKEEEAKQKANAEKSAQENSKK